MSGCSPEEAEAKSQKNDNQVISDLILAKLKANAPTAVKVTKSGTGYQAEFSMKATEFQYRNEAQERARFETSLGTKIKGIFSGSEKLQRMIVHVDGVGEGIFLRKDVLDSSFAAGEYFEYDEGFLLSLRTKTQKGSKIVSISVEKSIINNETNSTRLDIEYVIGDVNLLGELDRNGNKKFEDSDVFEEDLAGVVRSAFELFPKVEQVNVTVMSQKADLRIGNSTDVIARYTLDRQAFVQIMQNWDNLLYRIYDSIEYTPIYRLDLVSSARIDSMKPGRNTIINMTYDAPYASMEKSLGIMESDARNIILELFRVDKSVQSAKIVFTAKVPAKEGEKTADGVHRILYDFYTVTADRQTWSGLKAESLNDQQYLFNFVQEWNSRVMELNIIENLFSKQEYFRSFAFSGSEVEISLDPCIFKKDTTFARQLSVSERKGDSIEDFMAEQLFTYTKKLIFEIHPPYLEEVTWTLEKPYLDSTGNEIDVSDFGDISFEKQDDANYYFQTEEEDLEWIEERKESLDTDDEELCQIA